VATTLKSLATACGVDVSTASRALRGDPRVAAATRAAVEAAARRLDYRPNLAGRRLQAGRTGTVWFVSSALGNVREREPAEHASRLLAKAGYDTLIAVHLGEVEAYRRIIGRLDQGVTDGVLIIPSFGEDVEVPLFQELLRRRYPLCLLDRWFTGLAAPGVTTDNHAAGAALARGLLDLGAEQVVVDLPGINTVQQARRDGALSVLGNRAAMTPTAGHIGLLCNSQYEMQRLLPRFAARGRRLCVAVFDDWRGDPYPAHTALAAIQDFPGMAARAVERLLAMIAAPAAWKPGIDLVPIARTETIVSAVNERG
jgi:DNA-binding LacI/PurR family transcriptional regulator